MLAYWSEVFVWPELDIFILVFLKIIFNCSYRIYLYSSHTIMIRLMAYEKR